MILTANQLIEIIDVQTYENQTVTNRYFYWTTQSPDSESDFTQVANDFTTKVIDVMLPLQSVLLDHIRVEVRPKVGVALETVVGLTGKTGTVTGQGANSVLSCKFTLGRSTNVTRVGMKRVGGLGEESMSGNRLTSAFDPIRSAIEVAMLQPVVQNGFSWQPVIARLENQTTDDWTINIVSGITSTDLVTTQNSRKQSV